MVLVTRVTDNDQQREIGVVGTDNDQSGGCIVTAVDDTTTFEATVTAPAGVDRLEMSFLGDTAGFWYVTDVTAAPTTRVTGIGPRTETGSVNLEATRAVFDNTARNANTLSVAFSVAFNFTDTDGQPSEVRRRAYINPRFVAYDDAGNSITAANVSMAIFDTGCAASFQAR